MADQHKNDDDLNIPELDERFFAEAILTRPGENLIEKVHEARNAETS